MDYTKDNKFMKLLTELSNEIQGLNYYLTRTSDEKILSSRKKSVNDAVEKVKEHLIK